MDGTVRIFAAGAVIGLGLATFALVIDVLHERRIVLLENAVATARAKCESTWKMPNDTLPPFDPNKPFTVYLPPSKGSAATLQPPTPGQKPGPWDLACDPDQLAREPLPQIDMQERVAEAQRALDLERVPGPMEPSVIIAVAAGILALASVPWAWYFLLRRIRELSNAIRGR
jgi:hypothetical protein